MHWDMSWVGIEPGLGMLGIDCMKHKISMVVFVAFFFLHFHCWFGICCREGRGGEGGAGGGLRLGVNIVKCRNGTT